MNLADAVILGIIQGLTEFLPVSSSAHLVIVQNVLPGFHQPGILFDILLHLGTLTAVLFFLRKEIFDLLAALLPSSFLAAKGGEGGLGSLRARRKTIVNLLLATFVTGIIGLYFREEVERLFTSAFLASFMLIITGILLFLAHRTDIKPRQGREDIRYVDSLIIGIAQGVAILPGISRSGVTISAGIFRGLTHDRAAVFSFLLSVPAVCGAVILEARHISNLSYGDIPAYVTGFSVAALTGFLSLKLLFYILKNRRLGIFAYYCWALGFSVLLFGT